MIWGFFLGVRLLCDFVMLASKQIMQMSNIILYCEKHSLYNLILVYSPVAKTKTQKREDKWFAVVNRWSGNHRGSCASTAPGFNGELFRIGHQKYEMVAHLEY
jgi:hypothetical protein